MPLSPVVARAGLHFWEEPSISGTNGSGTVFFSGCSLKCVYCQNFELSHDNFGKPITSLRLSEIFRELENNGAHNINLVNPTHYVDAIKEALRIYRPNIPLVYNSSGYDNPEVIAEDLFDIYLMDLKYISSERSYKYSCASDYFEYASQSIKAAYKNHPEAEFSGDIMQSGLIVRHLILPFGTNESLRVIDWFGDNVPNAYFSLMAQYIPCGNAANFPEINRKITKREYDKVVNYLLSKELENVYIQERDSADSSFVPNFDNTGV